ncbi:MAG: trigger factor [Clostridiaceae bacterium]
MDYKIEKISSNQMKLEVTVSAEEYQASLKKSFEKNREMFQIQGFRKGKAPYEMVKRKFGVEALYEDADNFSLNDSYFKIVEENKIESVDYPQIDITDRSEEEGLKYTAIVDVIPEFVLPEINGMEVPKHDHPFSETDVDNEMEAMREKNSRLLSKAEGSAAEKGDHVSIDFDGTVDGVAFDGGASQDFDLELGSGSFIGNFEEQLEGLKVGEEKDVVVTFPEAYGVDELNGKEAIFKVKLNGIKTKELPELNDEFASEVSEFETVEELRGDLHKRMKEDYDKHMEDAARESALTALVEKTDIDVPNALVERQLDNMVKDLVQRLSYQGLDLKTYYQLTGSTEESSREQMKENAVKRAKTDLVIDKLIENSEVETTEDELIELAKEYAKMYSQDEKFSEQLLKTNKSGLEHDVKLKKVLADLVTKVTFVDGHDPMAHHEE